ncbi:MAG: LamG domain-containing protein [Candidatus Micrarchaeota archaeon]|nr:LamG domain-containing protein [Candidatus Micrarchaeota archaeon]
MRSQSAMEYLMTYGWAILAIAIVMVSLYSLGIFNTALLAPKANPGACEVLRTASQASLAGQCTNMVPKYAAKLDGATSNIYIPSTTPVRATGSFTVNVWSYYGVNAYDSGSPHGMVCAADGSGLVLIGGTPPNSYGYHFDHVTNNGYSYFYTSTQAPLKKWTMYTFTYNASNGTAILYLNGTELTSDVVGTDYQDIIQNNPSLYIGTCPGLGYFNGTMSNIQIYNRTLTVSDVNPLYKEGIGGAPIDIQHLIGWWPLNGDARDYSGNNRNGNITNVAWSASWYSTYTYPKS